MAENTARWTSWHGGMMLMMTQERVDKPKNYEHDDYKILAVWRSTDSWHIDHRSSFGLQ